MKKKMLAFTILILYLLSIMAFAMAADNDSEDTGDIVVDEESSVNEKSQVERAYDCLENKIEERTCAKLSLEEKIFSLWTVNKCKKEVIAESNANQCWPKDNCNAKTTAQAILALGKSNLEIEKAEQWLISKNETPQDVDWYLQIESPEQTTCSISYSGSSYNINIGEDKKINSGAGNCLTLSEGSWWLRVSPTCHNTIFEVSCDKSFITTLLFKKKTSSTIHVSEKTSSSSAEGVTEEKVSSFCFTQGGSCDYEASLWATLAMDYLNRDTSPYMPYLITMSDEAENKKYLPEAFLYALGYDDFRSKLLLKHKLQYWDESGDKFYDSALASFAFQYEEPDEKLKTVDWLMEIQGKDGCWDSGNVVNNAFILYSLWPRTYEGESAGIDCIGAGYDCISELNCEGEILAGYSCAGVFKCCSVPKSVGTCEEQGGLICTLDQTCSGGTSVEADDVSFGESCCIGGFCELPPPISECEENFGTCEAFECNEDMEETTSYTCNYGDICCMQKETAGSNLWWILLLIILIILVVLAIVFRDKLRPYWYRLKSKFQKKPSQEQGRPSSTFPMRRPMQRRIMPPAQRPQPIGRPPTKPSSELDDVLKKLKDMGQ